MTLIGCGLALRLQIVFQLLFFLSHLYFLTLSCIVESGYYIAVLTSVLKHLFRFLIDHRLEWFVHLRLR